MTIGSVLLWISVKQVWPAFVLWGCLWIVITFVYLLLSEDTPRWQKSISKMSWIRCGLRPDGSDSTGKVFFYIFSLVWIVYMQSCRSSVIKELHAWNYYLSSRMNHLFALSIASGLQDIVSESENMNSFTVFQIKVNSPACILGMPVWGIWPISMAASAQASLYLQRYLSKRGACRWNIHTDVDHNSWRTGAVLALFIKLCVRAANLRPWRKVRRHEPAG